MIDEIRKCGIPVDIPTVCVLWRANNLPYQIAPLDTWGLAHFVSPAQIVDFASTWWSQHPDSVPPEIEAIAAAGPTDSIGPDMESLCLKSDVPSGARNLRFFIIRKVIDSDISIYEKAGYINNCAISLQREFGLDDDTSRGAVSKALGADIVPDEEYVRRVEDWLKEEFRIISAE